MLKILQLLKNRERKFVNSTKRWLTHPENTQLLIMLSGVWVRVDVEVII